MAEQKKAVCGGFYIGDGLEMDGKTLYATGGSSGGETVFVECHASEDLQDITCDVTYAQFLEMIASGKNVKLVVVKGTEPSITKIYLELATTAVSPMMEMIAFQATMFSMGELTSNVVIISNNNVITGMIFTKDF